MKFLYDKPDKTVGLMHVLDGDRQPARIVGRDATSGELVFAKWSAVRSAWEQYEPDLKPVVQSLPEGLVEAIVAALAKEGIQSVYINGIAERVAQVAYSFCPSAP